MTEMTEEQYLHEQLAMLRQSYQDAAKPIVDRLVAIKQNERPRPILLSREEAVARGLMLAL